MIVLKDDWQDATSWDHFVEHHEQARFCHLFGYAAVLNCYGYAPRNLCFVQDGTIVGVLPAVQIKSLFSGRRLVSQPFSEYGGLLLDPNLSEQDCKEIFSALVAFAQKAAGIDLIEMHGNHGVPQPWRDNWALGPVSYHVAILPLNRPIDELWGKVVRYSVRKAVNQARNHGLKVVFECDEKVIRERFFPLYLKSMKRLGVPPHSIEYFLHCYRVFGEKMLICWAMKDATPVAGLLGFSCGGRVSIINTVSNPDQWHLRPNDLLHWELIQWAAETNHKFFDFGSIRYQGQSDWKKKWGCECIEHKLYSVNVGARASPNVLNSSSKRMQTIATLWSKYVPLAITQAVGPMIRRQLAR